MGKKLLGVICVLFLCMTACAFAPKEIQITLTENGDKVMEYLAAPSFKTRLKLLFKYHNDAVRYAREEDVADLLGDFSECAEKVFAVKERAATEPSAVFESGQFVYREGNVGVRVNREVTLRRVLERYRKEPCITAELETEAVFPQETITALKARTQSMGEYATVYSESSSARKENVKIAADRLNNVCVASGQKLSFNEIVGCRIEENGFRKAPVIEYGQYTDGVGGGVCQVSTTLYNAALMAGLKVEKVQHHSLPVHYVSPSFDAMVSEWSDLVIENDTPFPVYLWSYADGTTVGMHFYGFSKYRGKTVKLVSVTLEETETDEYERRETEEVMEEEILRYPKKGLKSEGFVEIYDGGVLISRTRVRKDTYLPQKGILLVPKEEKENLRA